MAWNRSNSGEAESFPLHGGKRASSLKRKGFRFSIRGALAGLIVVVGASVAAWLIFGRSGVRPDRLTEKGPARKITDVGTNAASRASKSLASEAEPEQVKTNAFVVKRYGHSSNVPLSDTNLITYVHRGGIRNVDAEGNEHKVKTTPIFKSRADNMLWAAIRPGGMPSGLNALRSRMRYQTGSDAAFLEAIRKQEITVEPDDPPHVVTAKNATIEMKDAIAQELDSGRSFDDIYKELSDATRKERMYERIAQSDMQKMIRARDSEAIRKYVRDMNPVMESMGLKKLRVPSWAQEGAENNE